ncbi:MAG: DOMON domain-containing protein, partial [Candidatus Bipolaricaulota bacterium]
SPGEQPQATIPASPEQTIPTAVPTPVQPEAIVVAQPEPKPDPTPEPTPEPVVPTTPSSSVPIVDGIIHAGEYAHAMEAGGFRVYWTNDTVVLRVGLFSPGTGYVAIGLDPDRRMQGANFIIGAVRNGQMEIRDDYGTGSVSHSSDIENGGADNILAAAGRELNGETTIEFIIPLDSGDRFDKPLKPGETYGILVSFHDTSDNFSTRHSQRGTGEIQLDDPRP